MNIKTIKTEKFEGLAVLVPDDASGFTLKKTTKGKPDQLHYFVPYTLDVVSNQRLVILPNEGYKILGKETELTEEQCAEIVETGIFTPNDKLYLDYSDVEGDMFDSAKESFASLMQSIGCYSVNPYGNKPEFVFNNYGKSPDEFNRFELDMFRWQESQANTDTRLILKKL